MLQNSRKTCTIETGALARRWKWKLPTMNHQILAANWHLAQKYYSECLQQLCTIAVRIQTKTNDTSMYTLSQQTLRAASLSYMHWKTNKAGSIIVGRWSTIHVFS